MVIRCPFEDCAQSAKLTQGEGRGEGDGIGAFQQGDQVVIKMPLADPSKPHSGTAFGLGVSILNKYTQSYSFCLAKAGMRWLLFPALDE